jgi:hypothetical protein
MKGIILLVVPVIFLCSCIGNKKIAAAKEKLGGLKGQHEQEVSQIKGIDTKAAGKLGEGKIDSNINSIISTRVNKLRLVSDSVQKQIDSLESLMKDSKTARKNYKKVILPMLDSLQAVGNKYASRLTVYLMVQEALNVADFKLFDLAAFFGPGKYAIPEDKLELASQSFSPIIDSLILFSNKHSDLSRTATLVILGFADGSGFEPGGELYNTLLSLLGKPEASKQELNQKLSELRAQELIKQLTGAFLKKAAGFQGYDQMKIVYLGQGRGESYPLPTIKDYREDDERRRIVLCYWVVLPD